MAIAGLILATVLPFMRKTILNKIEDYDLKQIVLMLIKFEDFDLKYLYHTLVAAVWTNGIVFVVIADWQLPTGTFPDIAILVFAFAYGFGGIGAQKMAVQYYRLIRPLDTT